MENADGSVVIEVDIDPSEADKELGRLKTKIKNLERAISKDTGKKMGLSQEAAQAAATLDEAKAKLYEMKNAARGTFSSEEIAEQKERVRGLQTEYNRTDSALQRVTERLKESNADLASMQTEAGELQKQIDATAGSSNRMEEAFKKTEKIQRRFASRMREIVTGALFFNLVSAGLTQFVKWTKKAILSNSEATASVARLKGALLTLAQPLLEVIIPAFTAFVNVLAKVVSAIATIVSTLFGKTAKQSWDAAESLYEEQNALEGVGSAAKEAAGSLAGFDEINTISTENAGGGGGGGGVVGEIAPSFEIDPGMADKLKEISDLVGMIASGFALWKIGSMLPGILGTIAQNLGSILISLGGILLYWDGLTDAWENGVDWGNLLEMVGGLASAAFGLHELLGPIASGIALVVGGLGLLATSFRDALENGWTLENVLGAIAGLVATGLGISFLTGSFVPALIGALAGLLLAITVTFGDGQKLIEDMKLVAEGFLEFFTGIFTGDMEKTMSGLGKMFEGLEGIVSNVLGAIENMLTSFLDWLDKKTGGRFHGIIETAKGFVHEFFETANTILGNLLSSVEQIFTGIIQFISGVFTGDWERAWAGIQNIFKGIWNGIVGTLEGAVNLIIKGLNWLISQLNKISFSTPDWLPDPLGGKRFGINIPHISKVSIPRLATGAVIPPNREFMAVLGDQPRGNNIEAPEALIRKIVREESGGRDTQILEAILDAIRAGHIIMVDGTVFGRTAIKSINNLTASAGRTLLKV